MESTKETRLYSAESSIPRLIRRAFAESLAVAMAVVVLAGCAVADERATPTIRSAELVDYGLYEHTAVGRERADDVTLGFNTVTTDKRLLVQTDRIPGRLGTNFGFRYKLLGHPPGETVPVTIRVVHPELRHPTSGRVFPYSEWTDGAWIGKINWHTGWIFEEKWEIQPGEWKIQLFFAGEKLLERSFEVFDPSVEEDQEAVVMSGPETLLIQGVVEEIYPSPQPLGLAEWVVRLKVEESLGDSFNGESFEFRVHSPAHSGLEEGKRYQVVATRTDEGYSVDETQWRTRPLILQDLLEIREALLAELEGRSDPVFDGIRHATQNSGCLVDSDGTGRIGLWIASLQENGSVDLLWRTVDSYLGFAATVSRSGDGWRVESLGTIKFIPLRDPPTEP
jgi:hypothetical protein